MGGGGGGGLEGRCGVRKKHTEFYSFNLSELCLTFYV